MNNLIKNLNLVSKYKNIGSVYNLINNYNDNDWDKYMIKNPVAYQKTIISKDENYELVLINWEKGSFTSLHNHPENGCVMKVLNGNLIEFFQNNTKTLVNNDTNIRLKDDEHMILAKEKSYSLHYYSPPNYYN